MFRDTPDDAHNSPFTTDLPQIRETLLALLSDEDPKVRLAAARAMLTHDLALRRLDGRPRPAEPRARPQEPEASSPSPADEPAQRSKIARATGPVAELLREARACLDLAELDFSTSLPTDPLNLDPAAESAATNTG